MRGSAGTREVVVRLAGRADSREVPPQDDFCHLPTLLVPIVRSEGCRRPPQPLSQSGNKQPHPGNCLSAGGGSTGIPASRGARRLTNGRAGQYVFQLEAEPRHPSKSVGIACPDRRPFWIGIPNAVVDSRLDHCRPMAGGRNGRILRVTRPIGGGRRGGARSTTRPYECEG